MSQTTHPRVAEPQEVRGVALDRLAALVDLDPLDPRAACPGCSGALDDIPPEHRIHNHVELPPGAWMTFQNLIADPPEPTPALVALFAADVIA